MVAIHAGISYFNNYFLFPELLRKRQYFGYILSLVLSLFLGSFFIALILLQLDTIAVEEKAQLWSFGFILNNLIAVTTTVAVSMSLKLIKQWYERERQNVRLVKLQTETELKYLKSQINPHFLFNTLNTIYALAIKKSDQTPEVVLKLSEILRYLLYEGGEPMVPLSKELNYVKNYLELEKIRYSNRVQIDFECKGDISKHKIAPMLLLTFLENSFKHGVQTTAGKSFVSILVESKQHEIDISIMNSNQKSAHPGNNKPGGIGLENIQKRLNLMYPNSHDLQIIATDEKFEVNLRILTTENHNQ